ncbi:MAG: adenylate kinase [bacterium]|nr:adenylate kinase [bacterium]
MTRVHRIVMLGAPGAGKGTQAVRLAEHFQIPTISTGELFRQHIRTGTELGELAATYIDGGNLVPDDITIRMVKERLSRTDVEGGFILDGFPRTVVQAEALGEMLGEEDITAVVELWVDAEEVIPRLLNRAATEARSDDTAEVIRQRIKVYREQTRPLHEYYIKEGTLREINAVGEIEQITERILAELER